MMSVPQKVLINLPGFLDHAAHVELLAHLILDREALVICAMAVVSGEKS